MISIRHSNVSPQLRKLREIELNYNHEPRPASRVSTDATSPTTRNLHGLFNLCGNFGLCRVFRSHFLEAVPNQNAFAIIGARLSGQTNRSDCIPNIPICRRLET